MPFSLSWKVVRALTSSFVCIKRWGNIGVYVGIEGHLVDARKRAGGKKKQNRTKAQKLAIRRKRVNMFK